MFVLSSVPGSSSCSQAIDSTMEAPKPWMDLPKRALFDSHAACEKLPHV